MFDLSRSASGGSNPKWDNRYAFRVPDIVGGDKRIRRRFGNASHLLLPHGNAKSHYYITYLAPRVGGSRPLYSLFAF